MIFLIITEVYLVWILTAHGLITFLSTFFITHTVIYLKFVLVNLIYMYVNIIINILKLNTLKLETKAAKFYTH